MTTTSFKKYLFTEWPTLGREVIDLIKARTGQFCSVPYSDITAHAIAWVAAEDEARKPSAWPTEVFRTWLRGQLVERFAPTPAVKESRVVAPAVRNVVASQLDETPSGWSVSTTDQDITKGMLARVEYLVGDLVDKLPRCCASFDRDEVLVDLAVTMLERAPYGECSDDPMLWGRADMLERLDELEGFYVDSYGQREYSEEGHWLRNRHEEHEGAEVQYRTPEAAGAEAVQS